MQKPHNIPQDMDPQKILRMTQSPAGKQLISMLQSMPQDRLNRAAALASSGNYQQASALLQDFLTNPEAKDLLEQMGK